MGKGETFRGFEEEAMTRSQYDAFEADHDRSPTQDPPYNHSAGDPNWREVPATKPGSVEAEPRNDLLEASFDEWNERMGKKFSS